jgi:hypothetical protein
MKRKVYHTYQIPTLIVFSECCTQQCNIRCVRGFHLEHLLSYLCSFRPALFILLENGWMDFYKNWYWDYAIGDWSNSLISNFLHAIIPTWRMLKLVRWESDTSQRYHYPWSSATTDDVVVRNGVMTGMHISTREWMNFYEIWYRRYDWGDYSKLTF